MKKPTPSLFVSIRVTPQEKIRLIQMSHKAGDPNPSVTIVRKLFGRAAANRRTTSRYHFSERARHVRIRPLSHAGKK